MYERVLGLWWKYNHPHFNIYHKTFSCYQFHTIFLLGFLIVTCRDWQWRSISFYLHVLKCHTHKTFLHITLHGNTENRQKTALQHAYKYRFCIFPFVLTFTKKHLTPPLLPLIWPSLCPVVPSRPRRPLRPTWMMLFIVVISCFQNKKLAANS